jgi:hypothetical protein
VFEKDDSSPSAMRRKYLFVVDVQKKSVIDNGQDIPIFIADHWSFVVNTNAKQQNKLNLHRTIYTPVTRHFGVRNSFHNPMPLQFDVPHTVDAFRKAFIRKPRLSEFSGWVRDILTSSLSPTSFGGGGSTWRRVKSQNKSVHSFDGLWQHLPLKSIFVIAIPCPEGPTGLFCVTVFVEHRLRPSSPTSECVSFAVNTDAEVVGNAQKLKKLVANLMKGMSWGDFADEPLPPGV